VPLPTERARSANVTGCDCRSGPSTSWYGRGSGSVEGVCGGCSRAAKRFAGRVHPPAIDLRGDHARPYSFVLTPNVAVAEVPPVSSADYQRTGTKRRHLGSDLNIHKMYDLYKEDCVGKGLTFVKPGVYQNIFRNEFNMSFHVPKKDMYMKCEQYNNLMRSYTAGGGV